MRALNETEKARVAVLNKAAMEARSVKRRRARWAIEDQTERRAIKATTEYPEL